MIAARRAADARIDHRVLFRIPLRTTDSVDRALECLPGGQPEGDVPLVSFEDHTPGQGQYRDIEQYKAAMSLDGGTVTGDLDAEIARRMAEARARARGRRDWQTADEARRLLAEHGFTVRDTKDGAVELRPLNAKTKPA